MAKKKKRFPRKKIVRTIFGGAMAGQAIPTLSAAGRTPAALTGTTTGFVQLGVAGAAAGVSGEMVDRAHAEGRPRKKRKRKR